MRRVLKCTRTGVAEDDAQAVEPPCAQPWSRATCTGDARRESPHGWPAQGDLEAGATVPFSRAAAELVAKTADGLPAVLGRTRGRGRENNKAGAGRGHRPLPPRRAQPARAGEPGPRPRPGAGAPGGHVGRGAAAAQPGTPRRPPPRTHQRRPAPRRTRGRLPARLSRRGAPEVRPRPPRPARPSSSRPTSPRSSARNNRTASAAAPTSARLPEQCPGRPARALRTRTRAASAPRRRPRFPSGHSQPTRLQVPAGGGRIPAAWRAEFRASFWFPGRWPRARRGESRAEIGTPALRSILGFVVFKDHRAWLGLEL